MIWQDRNMSECFKVFLKVFYVKLYVHSLVDKLKWFYENARYYNKIYRHCCVCSHRGSVIRGQEDSMKYRQVKSKGAADHAVKAYRGCRGVSSLITVMRRLTTGIRSEKCFVRRFRRCANVIECTYTNLNSITYYTPRLYGTAYCC